MSEENETVKQLKEEMIYSQRKKENKALSSCFLETRSIPDKDTNQREGLRGYF